MNHQTICAPHYRKQARKMRRLAAADQTEQEVRDELLKLADDYDHIASSAVEGTIGRTRIH